MSWMELNLRVARAMSFFSKISTAACVRPRTIAARLDHARLPAVPLGSISALAKTATQRDQIVSKW